MFSNSSRLPSNVSYHQIANINDELINNTFIQIYKNNY